MAMEQCKECYIVTDASKFDLIGPDKAFQHSMVERF